MNDRFNFRHWDKQINKMRYGDISLSSSGEPFILHCETERLLSIEDIDDVITMQCTGLKDKNGTLIYEGDIVKDVYNNLRIVEWNSVVLQYMANVYIYAIGDATFPMYLVQDLEVIGNIYENPELLSVRNEE